MEKIMYLSVCLFDSSTDCLSVCLSVFLSVHLIGYLSFCHSMYLVSSDLITSKRSTGLSKILATSRATFPCPSITAVSALKSGSS